MRFLPQRSRYPPSERSLSDEKIPLCFLMRLFPDRGAVRILSRFRKKRLSRHVQRGFRRDHRRRAGGGALPPRRISARRHSVGSAGSRGRAARLRGRRRRGVRLSSARIARLARFRILRRRGYRPRFALSRCGGALPRDLASAFLRSFPLRSGLSDRAAALCKACRGIVF